MIGMPPFDVYALGKMADAIEMINADTRLIVEL